MKPLTKARKMYEYAVVLKDGSDYSVRACTAKEAIRKVLKGGGRRVGSYIECPRKDSAERIK